MSQVTQANYDTLFAALVGLEEDRSEISADIRERIESFADQYGVNKKAVALNFKLFKLYQKDEGEYHEIAGDTDAYLSGLAGDV